MSIPQQGQVEPPGSPPARVHHVDIGAQQRWLRLDIRDDGGSDLGVVVLDPDRRVRAQYWGKTIFEQVVVGPDPASSSCGTVPGPLPAGAWRVEVFAAAGRPLSCSLRADSGAGDAPAGTLPAVGAHPWLATGAGADHAGADHAGTDHAGDDGRLRLDRRRLARRLRQGRAWYRGDFHAHTRASDGQQSPEALSRQASARGLDFFSVTEHNLLTTGWPVDEPLVVPGTEVTSAAGHFNAIGLHRWLDWRPLAPDGGCTTSEGMARLLRDTRAQGAIASVNHPLLPPWEWRWPDTPLDAFDAIEIWNDPTYPPNAEVIQATVRLWSRLWDDGHRIVGIGGSDTHLLPDDSYVAGGPPSVIGDPWTAVLADELSVVAIIDAVRAGRAYMSRGPVLDVWAEVGGDRFPPGASLTAALGRRPEGWASVRLHLGIANVGPGATAHWVGTDGEEAVAPEPADGTATSAVERVWDARTWRWIRAELRGSDGSLLAVTNPFSAGEITPRLRTWGDLLAAAQT